MSAKEGNKYALGNSGGAPTKYKKDFARQAYKLCLLGFTDKALADYFDVDEQTVNNWKGKHKEFFGSVKAGKAIADANVAESFYRRAIGYAYDEVTFEKIDSKTNLEITTTGDIKIGDSYKKKIVTKEVPPDPGAALNWLKNRQKDLWRDKQIIEVDFERFSDEHLDKIISGLIEKGK